MESKYFVKSEDVPAYSPKNHVGTQNRRLIGPDNGAKNLEVVLGVLEKGPGALPTSTQGSSRSATSSRAVHASR